MESEEGDDGLKLVRHSPRRCLVGSIGIFPPSIIAPVEGRTPLNTYEVVHWFGGLRDKVAAPDLPPGGVVTVGDFW